MCGLRDLDFLFVKDLVSLIRVVGVLLDFDVLLKFKSLNIWYILLCRLLFQEGLLLLISLIVPSIFKIFNFFVLDWSFGSKRGLLFIARSYDSPAVVTRFVSFDERSV